MLVSQLGVHMCSRCMHLSIKSRRNIFKRQQQTHLCTTIFSSPSHHLNIFSFPLNRPFHLFHKIPNINRNCIRLNTPDVVEYCHKHNHIISFCIYIEYLLIINNLQLEFDVFHMNLWTLLSERKNCAETLKRFSKEKIKPV